MDAEEIAALAAGMGKALADSLAANEEAKEARAEAAKKAKADAAESRRIAEKRSKALHTVLDVCDREQKIIASQVENSVARYCDKARRDAIEPLKKDPRMPRTIDYLKRYSALVGVQDRQAVLERLQSTIDLANEILDGAGGVDIKAAMTEAGAAVAERVGKLNGIRVSEADPVPTVNDDAVENFADSDSQSSQSDVSCAIEEAFAAILGELPDVEAQLADEIEAKKAREAVVDKQIEEATKAAMEAADSIFRRNAEAVAGAEFLIDQQEPFGGGVIVKLAKDVDQVKALSVEVGRSFKTFKQVVQDNGLFAAFASENAYGACNGYRSDWWWGDEIYVNYDGAIPGRQKYNDIPVAVEEDEGGDTLDKSIERMRSFNEQKYWGMLDDDFQVHVDAFWYGFKKLMVNVNGLFEVDLRAFGNYYDKVRAAAKAKAKALGMQMDSYQAERFCKEVAERSRG